MTNAHRTVYVVNAGVPGHLIGLELESSPTFTDSGSVEAELAGTTYLLDPKDVQVFLLGEDQGKYIVIDTWLMSEITH